MTTTTCAHGVASATLGATVNVAAKEGGSKIARGPLYSSACTDENENHGFGWFLLTAPYRRTRARLMFPFTPFSIRS